MQEGLPGAFSSSGRTTPNLSAFLHRRGVPPLRPFLWASSGPALTGPYLSCTEDPRGGCSTPGGVSQERIKGENHLPQPAGHASFEAAQDTLGFLGCKRTLPAHVQFLIHQYPQVLLCKAALNPFIPQSVLILGFAPNIIYIIKLYICSH